MRGVGLKSGVTGEKHGAKKFMSGVFVLSLSTFLVKVIGLAYKIPMLSYLGAQGMGYFNSAYEIYALLCVISTAGLPVALSMLVSSYNEAGQIGRIRSAYRTALGIFMFLGICGSALMFLLAGKISAAIENQNAYYSLIAISPALLCVCLSSAVRGYFQGFHCMYPTAISQLIEAVGKLVFGIYFATFAIDRGYAVPVVAAFAVAGLSLGTFVSALYLCILKAVKGKKYERGAEIGENGTVSAGAYGMGGNIGTLLKIAVPITLSSAVLGVTRIIDMALIMRRLQDIGYTSGAANSIYGSYTTIAVPVFGLIPSLITPISLALVPSLCAAIERRSEREQADVLENSVRLTVIFAMPCSFGITLYAKQIITLLFPGAVAETEFVAPLLSVLGMSVFFACMITTTNAVLQSYRKTMLPIISMAIGAAVKIAVAYILIGIPSINIYGAPISTFICDAVITVLNLYFIHRKAPMKGSVYAVYVKPLIASVVSMLSSVAVYYPVSVLAPASRAAFLCAVFTGAVAYVIISILIRSVTAEDIAMLPGGEKINRILGPVLKCVEKKGRVGGGEPRSS